MHRVLYILPLLAFLLGGCKGGDMLFPWLDADGYYEGWVEIDKPGLGFDRSFHASLRVWDNCHQARLRDDCGRSYTADHVDYDFWDDRLTVYFRVRETGWDPKCGYEIYDWEMRMAGRVRGGETFQGELQVDIDPEDYHSDHCYMDWNPPPTHLGRFSLELESDYDCY